MKALVLKQPWANLIRRGTKTIETRRWKTKYRGPLLIVAGKAVDREAAKLFNSSSEALLPQGAIVAAVNLKDIWEMTEADAPRARCGVYPGAYAWDFDLIYSFDKPVPAKGALGLFELDCPHPFWIDHAMGVKRAGSDVWECCPPFCGICKQTRGL